MHTKHQIRWGITKEINTVLAALVESAIVPYCVHWLSFLLSTHLNLTVIPLVFQQTSCCNRISKYSVSDQQKKPKQNQQRFAFFKLQISFRSSISHIVKEGVVFSLMTTTSVALKEKWRSKWFTCSKGSASVWWLPLSRHCQTTDDPYTPEKYTKIVFTLSTFKSIYWHVVEII